MIEWYGSSFIRVADPKPRQRVKIALEIWKNALKDPKRLFYFSLLLAIFSWEE